MGLAVYEPCLEQSYLPYIWTDCSLYDETTAPISIEELNHRKNNENCFKVHKTDFNGKFKKCKDKSPYMCEIPIYGKIFVNVLNSPIVLFLGSVPEIRIPAFNIPIAPGCSCSDKRGTNDKALKLKLLFFYIHVFLQAICEMIKYFASLIRGDATCKK